MKQLAGRVERLPHAILFHGMRGVGKLDLAERFARFLLCEAADREDAACGACDACRWFAAGNHPDFRRVEPEALSRQAPPDDADEEQGERSGRKSRPSIEIKIDQVRALSAFLNLGSHRGRRRVTLVHPAEDMNVHAANALLKALEEPPPGAVFVLVSHRPARLPPTILSRCVRVAVPLPERGAALAWLAAQGTQDAERWLAFAGGAPLRALEYAQGERGAAIRGMLDALERKGLDAYAAGVDRDSLEPFAEVLQKLALDLAFAGFGAGAKYRTAASAGVGDARAWLAFARHMGRQRALARHPLNPRLFAADLIARMPRLS